MTMTRRTFLTGSAVGLAGSTWLQQLLMAAPSGRIRISARHFSSDFEKARRAGMEGVEVGTGKAEDRLSIADPANRQKIKDQMKATGVVVSSLSMDLMNGYPVATEPRAKDWLLQCIEVAHDLGAVGILVPFFGKASLLKDKQLDRDAVDAVVARVKEVAPKAKAAGVCLGLENTCSAKQNLEILDRIGSEAVGCYYDIGNSTNGGYDVSAEIRELKERLCMIHFKDGKDYLGEGKVKMEPVAAALKAINYQGWIVLETSCPSKDPVADCKRNGDFTRKLMGIG